MQELEMKRGIPAFDAIIEGTPAGDMYDSTFKLIGLDVAENTNILNDGINRYLFHGTITYSGVNRDSSFLNPEETDIGQPLSSYPGAILTEYTESKISSNAVLEYPRAVFLEDGRIFIRENLDQDYHLKWLPDILKITIKMFEEDYESLAVEYQKIIGPQIKQDD